MPMSLKCLHISGSAKVDHSIIHVIEINQLETLTVSNWRPLNNFNPNKVISVNRSLVDFVCDVWIQNFRSDISEEIYKMKLRNVTAKNSAIKASLCLIACRQFRRAESGLLGLVPKELILSMAKQIARSYIEDAWQVISTHTTP
jgi:hypothetical protein